eukprot:5055072-Karenia_brevis.AAC.1
MYALVLVDECFQLDERFFEHVVNLHAGADRVPCVFLAGDQHQMGSPGGRSAFLSKYWENQITKVSLKYDPEYQRFTDKKWVELLNKM